MSRTRKLLPRYLSHPSGRGRAVWNDPTGRREKKLPGEFNSPESLQAFAKLQLELASSPEMPARTSNGPTVVEVCASYLRHATGYYGAGSELEAIKTALKIVRQNYGADAVADFGPKKLAAVREAFLQKGWSRPYVNKQVGKIVRAIRWAVGEELAPATVYQALKALAPLRRGHCEAPEPDPRAPADPKHVAAALPFLKPHVRTIVELLRCTGMRPAEVCRMTLDRIDRTGALWIYRPAQHKNEHRGHHRAVSLGMAAQAIIAGYLVGRTIGDAESLFSPRRQRDEKFAAMRAGRRSKVQPSQKCRKSVRPMRIPGERFTSNGIGKAVAKACEKAKVHGWTPYQLRHLKGAELRERFSLEHVRAALGHSHASMSAHYAKGADGKLAAEVAMATG